MAAGIGGSLVSGMLSPGTSGGGSSYYTPTGLPTADTTWQNLLSSINNAYGTNNPTPYAFQSLESGLNANNYFGPAYQAAAGNAGGDYSNLAYYTNQRANQNFDTQNALLGAGRQVFGMGLDPQSALYARTQQQVQDQVNANNSMYGLGSSAAGAGVANQAMANFNIDWQNNQLQRALQGLQGYAGAANTAGRFGELGTSQAASVPGYDLAAGSVPYQTAQSIASTPGSLANTYGSFLNSNVYGPAEGIMGTIIPYMNYGQGAQQVPFQAQSQGAGAAGSLVSQGISGLLGNQQVQNGISNFFNPASGSFSGGDFSGAFSSSPYYSGGGNSYGFTM
ncbi:hypothetical protein LGM71_19335 [Burkholderia sp. AU33545]|uniref:hypothetical protein n=1 Tax=Burkholderia sp. AU33545 TaxID=2879631 RepID=UPI001CF2C816|nr:hypothetical protein [Burkholderia sp. AU33545]MCA8203209.1 hypothetical protein [Burkholderia sp. AU33545]